MNIGWSASVLPWLEQNVVYAGLNFSFPYNVAVNSTAAYTVIRSTSAPQSPGKRTGTNRPARLRTRILRPTPTTGACTDPAGWCRASRITRRPGR